ncbi:MAG TPA: Rieske 2Fe-2S domain-containing protein [Candidatus Acidoferrales bacterium]|nr:Rieske 2Fe-2S domain-containing protein [Candidatus Acidoferrales bacterium]
MAFVRAASQGEIPAGTIRELHLAGRTIALANVEGRFYAIDNTCLHRGGPLGQGKLEGKVVTCPVHGWQYDVTTGQVTFSPEMAVRTYPVELRGDEIYVDAG